MKPDPTSRPAGGPFQARAAAPRFDVEAVRAAFPILATRTSSGKPLVYLDNGATTQKPRAVLDAVARYYAEQNANIHRGVYELSQLATALYEKARETVRSFLNAAEPAEVIFTSGTTGAINLVAHSYARATLKPGDEVVISALEHHSNIVPWQMACLATGATLRAVPINDAGELDQVAYVRLLASGRVKLVSVNHVSNSLGTVNPVKEMTALAHRAGAKVMIDGAQWVAHHPTDVRDIGCDFYAFSGHKLFGPTGIGVLYGRRELLDAMPPFLGGGDMIRSVTIERTEYAELPSKFEAGTPHIEGAIGLAAAIDYVRSVGFASFEAHERDLLDHATERLSAIPGVRIIGTAKHKASVISFVMDDPAVSSLDIGMALDAEGIAIRTGHHCCQPVMDRFGIASTSRLSLALYNTRADVDAAVGAIGRVRERAVAKGGGVAKSVGGAHPTKGESADVTFAPAAGPSPAAVADDLAELFEALGDRDARNEYLLEAGEKIPPMPAGLKTDATRVHGCMSVVHLVGRRGPGPDGVVEFVADSDAHIVRGLIAVLEKLFSGQPARAVLAFDVEAFFTRIGLEQFVTVQRRNGLAGMVKRIREIAAGA